MQISVFYDHITQARQQTGKSLSQLLGMCRSWGIEGVEINYTQLRRGGFKLRQELDRAGMSISCIYEFYDFTHNGDLKQAKKHVDLAAKVGAGKVLIVPGFLEEQEAKELEACCCGRKLSSSTPGHGPGERCTEALEDGGKSEDDGGMLCGGRLGQASEEMGTGTMECREKPGGGGAKPDGDRREQASEASEGAYGFEAVARYMESHASTCRVRDTLRELVDYGQEKGVRITLEDFDGNTSPCARMLPLKWLMEQVPGLGFTLDMGNFAYSDEDVMEAYKLLKAYIAHVHCKDRGREETCRSGHTHCQGLACVPTGGGYLPIGELITQLRAQGYDGYLAIEHFDAPDQTDYIRRSAEFLRTM